MRAGRAEKAPKTPEARGRTYERARPAPKPETPGLRTPLKLPDPVTLRAEERPLPPGLRAHLAKIIDPAAAYAATAHSGEASNEIARAYDARAVAIGKDIFFARGQLRFDTSDAINLIAHEVVHVAQALAGLLDRPAAKADTAPAAGPHEGAANAKAAAAVAPPKGEKKGAEGKGAEKAPAAKGEKPAGPAAKGEAGAGVAAGEAKAPPREPGEPIMPEPPKELSAAEKARIAHVEGKAEAAKEAQANVPKAGAEVETTQAAVQQPKAEADAKARGDLVTTLDDRPPPSPEIEQLCDKIRKVIRDKRPPDEDSLVDADPKAMAKAAGEEQNKQVKGDVDRVSGEYDAMQASPSGTPEPKPPDMTPTPAKVASPDIGAPAATPDKVPPQKVSLDADVEAGNKQIEDAGMNTEPAKLVEDGPIAEARGAQGDLADMAKKDPEKVLAEQNAKLAQASAGMKSLQQRTAAALAAARAAEVGKAETQKKAAKKSEEDLRAELGDKAKQTFKTAQDAVKDALKDVPDTAMAKWDAGVDKLSTQFKNTLNKVAAWIKDRHSGVGGFFLGIGDAIAGLPDWVTDEYDRAEQEFGDGVCALIEDISRDVNAVIKTCDDIIAQARKDIAKIFTEDIPDGLKDWAAQQEKDFGAKLDNLSKEVTQTKADFNKDLINRASQAVQDARAEIHDLREAAKGLIGKLKDAINEFLDDPVKFIINGLLKLLGIPPSAFWAVVAKIKQVISDIADDPLGFANNLMAGVSKGFSQFFDNIARHLLEGFLDWLFSGMRKDGMSIEVPREISLKSVITFFLSLLGISWARIRKLLVEQLGEKTVAILEKAAGIIYTLVTKGISGIFEEIAQFLEPQTIVDAIVDAAIKYLIETLIVKVTVRIIAMLNPAGAILAALEAIYRVLKWIFNNAARIFHLVEAVVDAMADVIAGNIGGVANAVEKALAMLIPPVIDFLADYLGLGGLPKKIADAVKGLQDMVERVLRKVVAWLVAQGRKLLAALGIKGKDKDKEKGKGGEVGASVTFTGGGETHRLFVKVSGANATLMVASTPVTVDAWIAHLRPMMKGMSDAKKSAAEKLFAQALAMASQLDKEADQEAKAKEQVEKGTEGAPDQAPLHQKTVIDEETLAPVLGQIADLFELKPFVPFVGKSGEPVAVDEKGGRPVLSVGGLPGSKRLTNVLLGALGKAKNGSGRDLVVGKRRIVDDAAHSLGDLFVVAKKIDPQAQEKVTSAGEKADGAVGEILEEMKIANLDRALTLEQYADPKAIEFFGPWSPNKNYRQKLLAEMAEQLKNQQEGINKMSVDQWAFNVNVYRLKDEDFAKMDFTARAAVLTELHERAEAGRDAATTRRGLYEDALKAIGDAYDKLQAEIKAGAPRGEQAAPQQITPVLDREKVAPRDDKGRIIPLGVVGRGLAGTEKQREQMEKLAELAKERGIKQKLVKVWDTLVKDLALLDVLHNADQIGGGEDKLPDLPPLPADDTEAEWKKFVTELKKIVGPRRINRSIGSQWQHKIDDLYKDATNKDKRPQVTWPIWLMNANLIAKERTAKP